MAVAGPSLPSAYAAAHVLKYKLPAFHGLKFLPALLSVPSGRYGSRTPIYCPNKSERVRPPVHQKKPLEQIKTRVCSSAQSRHTHTHTLICLGATPDCQIITSTRRASLKTWTHREGTRRARSSATHVSHVHTWELPGTTAHCHCCTNGARLIESRLINSLAQGRRVEGERERGLCLHSAARLFRRFSTVTTFTRSTRTSRLPPLPRSFALNMHLTVYQGSAYSGPHLGPRINT